MSLPQQIAGAAVQGLVVAACLAVVVRLEHVGRGQRRLIRGWWLYGLPIFLGLQVGDAAFQGQRLYSGVMVALALLGVAYAWWADRRALRRPVAQAHDKHMIMPGGGHAD